MLYKEVLQRVKFIEDVVHASAARFSGIDFPVSARGSSKLGLIPGSNHRCLTSFQIRSASVSPDFGFT